MDEKVNRLSVLHTPMVDYCEEAQEGCNYEKEVEEELTTVARETKRNSHTR